MSKIKTLDFIKNSINQITAAIAETEDELHNLKELKRSLEFDKQKYCPHTNTYTKDDFNYHTREDWKETYCSDCGKLLKRV